MICTLIAGRWSKVALLADPHWVQSLLNVLSGINPKLKWPVVCLCYLFQGAHRMVGMNCFLTKPHLCSFFSNARKLSWQRPSRVICDCSLSQYFSTISLILTGIFCKCRRLEHDSYSLFNKEQGTSTFTLLRWPVYIIICKKVYIQFLWHLIETAFILARFMLISCFR